MSKSLTKRINEGQPISKAVKNLNNSYYKRMTRINKRITEMLESDGKAYFVTFTIAPEYEHVSYSQLVKKIKEALGQASQYIFNADYGKTNGRLHFHGLINTASDIDYTTFYNKYKYGAINFAPIIVKNAQALKEYILKQQLHIEKQTASKVYLSRIKRNGAKFVK